jgi:ferredoxin
MKVTVIPNRCEGHGLCEGLAAELFEVTDEGVVHLLLGGKPIPEDLEEQAAEAVRTCPMGALQLEP